MKIELGNSGLVLHVEDDGGHLAIAHEGHRADEAIIQITAHSTGQLGVRLHDTENEGRDLLGTTNYASSNTGKWVRL